MLRLLVRLIVAGLGVWLALALYLFVWPCQDHPRHVAAIVVLAGDAEHRFPLALALARAGVAPVLVVSDGVRSSWLPASRLCAHPSGHRFRVICFHPRPYSTRGEARGALTLAERNHWRSLLVVTSTYHLFRARMLFKRCIDGRARVYATGTSASLTWLPVNMASETFKLALGLTTRRGC